MSVLKYIAGTLHIQEVSLTYDILSHGKNNESYFVKFLSKKISAWFIALSRHDEAVVGESQHKARHSTERLAHPSTYENLHLKHYAKALLKVCSFKSPFV